MEVKAIIKHLRMSVRKARLVIDVVRGLDVEQAENQLHFINKEAVKPVDKLIKSAVANAIHNFNLRKDNLYIKEIKADMGPSLQRWQPKAHGRATILLKHSCHISIILAERIPTVLKKEDDKESKLTKNLTVEKNVEEKSNKVKGEKKQIVRSDFPKERKEKKLDDHKKEIIDPAMLAKRRHQEHQDKKELGKGKGKAFINKIFNRKSM